MPAGPFGAGKAARAFPRRRRPRPARSYSRRRGLWRWGAARQSPPRCPLHCPPRGRAGAERAGGAVVLSGSCRWPGRCRGAAAGRAGAGLGGAPRHGPRPRRPSWPVPSPRPRGPVCRRVSGRRNERAMSPAAGELPPPACRLPRAGARSRGGEKFLRLFPFLTDNLVVPCAPGCRPPGLCSGSAFLCLFFVAFDLQGLRAVDQISLGKR